MENATLVQYIKQRIQSGVSRSVIEEELRTVGWSEEAIVGVYRQGLIDCGLPVPDEKNQVAVLKKTSTVDIVINFFSFILLGIVVTAVGTLLFAIIDDFFPDPLYPYDVAMPNYSSAIHYAISALIIGFPLYYFSMRLWFRTFREDEGRVESKLSQWLTYLVLLITAVTIVGDLIAIIFTFLQGEITVRFFLKSLIILVIAGCVFGFYYLERRKIQYHIDIPRKTFVLFGRGVSMFILTAILLGFFVAGLPATERQYSFDRTRIENLQNVANCVEQYAKTFHMLPKSFADIQSVNTLNYCTRFMYDPENASQYEYSIVSTSIEKGTTVVGRFELCAVFALDSKNLSSLSGPQNSNADWQSYAKGRTCFERETPLSFPQNPVIVQ